MYKIHRLHLVLTLFLFFIHHHLVRATSTLQDPAIGEPPATCVHACSQRTLSSIVWGCISTIFICSWTSVHPNLPPREGGLKTTLRRLELMFWAILAPEFLPLSALNQALAARKAVNMYNESKGLTQDSFVTSLKHWVSLQEFQGSINEAWTMRHGHFLIMGGFHLVEPPGSSSDWAASSPEVKQEKSLLYIERGKPTGHSNDTKDQEAADAEKGQRGPSRDRRVTILTLEMLEELLKEDDFEIRVADDEIADKCKGDALSKVIFMFQTSWFITQCIARHVQGLELTALELTTASLASLNAITFILWWQKPLGAQTPMRVYLTRRLKDEIRNVGRNDPVFVAGGYRTIFLRTLKHGLTTILRKILFQKEESFSVCLGIWILLPFLVPLFMVTIPIMISIFSTGDLLMMSSFPPDATHVPTLYVSTIHTLSHIKLQAIFVGITGVIIGGIHLAGWNMVFPTHLEQQLWRYSSSIVTAIPVFTHVFIVSPLIVFYAVAIVFAVLGRILSFFAPAHPLALHSRQGSGPTNFLDSLPTKWRTVVDDLDNKNRGFAMTIILRVLGVVMAIFYTMCGVIYFGARLLLLILAVALLRNLPPSAFAIVDWTQFYPHIL